MRFDGYDLEHSWKSNNTSPFACHIYGVQCLGGYYQALQEFINMKIINLIRYIIKYQCYADDTQMYMTLKSCDIWYDISSSIEACNADRSTWMNSNMLKCNKNKT